MPSRAAEYIMSTIPNIGEAYSRRADRSAQSLARMQASFSSFLNSVGEMPKMLKERKEEDGLKNFYAQVSAAGKAGGYEGILDVASKYSPVGLRDAEAQAKTVADTLERRNQELTDKVVREAKQFELETARTGRARKVALSAKMGEVFSRGAPKVDLTPSVPGVMDPMPVLTPQKFDVTDPSTYPDILPQIQELLGSGLLDEDTAEMLLTRMQTEVKSREIMSKNEVDAAFKKRELDQKATRDAATWALGVMKQVEARNKRMQEAGFRAQSHADRMSLEYARLAEDENYHSEVLGMRGAELKFKREVFAKGVEDTITKHTAGLFEFLAKSSLAAQAQKIQDEVRLGIALIREEPDPEAAKALALEIGAKVDSLRELETQERARLTRLAAEVIPSEPTQTRTNTGDVDSKGKPVWGKGKYK